MLPKQPAAHKLVVLLMLVCLGGCSATAKRPTGERVVNAVKSALVSPATWIPATGAAVIAATKQDKAISEYAMKHTPVFSSRDKANKASDTIKRALKYGAVASTIFVPMEEKWTLAGSHLIAHSVTRSITDTLKGISERLRPNKKDMKSMPSGHSSEAFSLAQINNINLNYYDFSPETKTILNFANYGMAASVAWARVEAGYHYPTDVLMGAALGNFVTVLTNKLFFPEEESRVSTYFNFKDKAVGFGYSTKF